MNSYNLSQRRYSQRADVIDSSLTIYNPRYSSVNTLGGADQLLADVDLRGDFGFAALVDVQAYNADVIAASLEFLGQINVDVKGIENDGYIQTGRGRDVVKGDASAVISANTVTVSHALAAADASETSVITDIFAALDLWAIADGIDNSGGRLKTGKGSDNVVGTSEGSVSATAIAVVDASSIVDAVVDLPYTEHLQAVALAIATSLTDATIIATGVNNQSGVITTNRGRDQIDAFAQSDSSTFSSTNSTAFASASPETQAIALTIAEATATAIDIAIAINNRNGVIRTGKGKDVINAMARGSYEAIAIDNVGGLISTGKGADEIVAHASADNPFGIIGGIVDLGRGDDSLWTGLLANNVQVYAGAGNDHIRAFGDATLNGGSGVDSLVLETYVKEDFEITLGADQHLTLSRNDMTLNVMSFERFIFSGNTIYTSAQDLIA